MLINIVSNLREAKGLAVDFRILAEPLVRWGHEVRGIDLREASAPSADLTISLEVCKPHLLGERNWIVPNPEWWSAAHTAHLDRFEKVLCKTLDGLRLMSAVTDRASYLGFASDDRRDDGPRERRFWCNPGESIAKGGDAVMAAWSIYRLPHPLTFVGSTVPDMRLPPVTHARRMDPGEHRREQNAHLFHLCPSHYEGFGHHLHEAMGIGAVIATTDAPPMNEIPAAVLIKPKQTGKLQLATTQRVSPEGVRDAVELMAAMSDAEVREAGEIARAAFDAEREAFLTRLRALMEAA